MTRRSDSRSRATPIVTALLLTGTLAACDETSADGEGDGTGGAGGTAGDSSPCPTASAACCEALDEDACDFFGDACRWVGYKSFVDDLCMDGTNHQQCFFVDVDQYPPEYPTGTMTATGAGTGLYRALFNGTYEVGLFPGANCGIHGWTPCSGAGSPPACGCLSVPLDSCP